MILGVPFKKLIVWYIYNYLPEIIINRGDNIIVQEEMYLHITKVFSILNN